MLLFFVFIFPPGYQRVIAESLSEMRQQINAVMLNQAKILSHVAPEDELYDPTNMPPLFIKSEDKLEEFEAFLRNPTNFKSYVSCFLTITKFHYLIFDGSTSVLFSKQNSLGHTSYSIVNGHCK